MPDRNICIVCPHTREEHYIRESDNNNWCRPCNKDELTGPCSYYFIGRHEYQADGIKGTCLICRLGPEHEAHQ